MRCGPADATPHNEVGKGEGQRHKVGRTASRPFLVGILITRPCVCVTPSLHSTSSPYHNTSAILLAKTKNRAPNFLKNAKQKFDTQDMKAKGERCRSTNVLTEANGTVPPRICTAAAVTLAPILILPVSRAALAIGKGGTDVLCHANTKPSPRRVAQEEARKATRRRSIR